VETGGKGPSNGTALLAALVAALALAVFWPAGSHPFVIFDDALYVFDNPDVLKGLTPEGISWAFGFHAANWHPLTWISHMADVSLFGADAAWHHRVGIGWHALNAVLLFLVLRSMTGATRRSAFVAAVFAVHPMHVESVAWVAERKDLLSTFFAILATWGYARYARDRRPASLLAATVLFALALLAKPMVVTLPFVFLLLDYWPLRRLSFPPAAEGEGTPLLPLVVEKAPLFALSALSCVLTYLAQAEGGAVASAMRAPLGTRVANAFVSYAAYAGKSFWPASLSVYYPLPRGGVPAWQAAGAAAMLAAVTAGVLLRGRRSPWLPVGWFWFLGTLVPVIGIVQVGGQAMADRYTYFPMIGLSIVVAWGAAELVPERWPHRSRALAAAAVVVVAVLSLAARERLADWKDSTTLFSQAVGKDRDNWVAWDMLGLAYGHEGDHPKALAAFGESVRINPDYARSRANYGMAAEFLGDSEGALRSFREALRLEPDLPVALYHVGTILASRGDRQGATEAYLRLRAKDPEGGEILRRAIGAP
jgi:hypothetical protein